MPSVTCAEVTHLGVCSASSNWALGDHPPNDLTRKGDSRRSHQCRLRAPAHDCPEIMKREFQLSANDPVSEYSELCTLAYKAP